MSLGRNLKAAANNAFLALFRDYSDDGVRTYIDAHLIQHNPFVPTGREALIGFLPALKQTGIAYTNHRILQDGEFVVLHNSFTNAHAFGAARIVTFDIYRMKNGKAAEHWDAIAPIVETTASGRSQVDGDTAIRDLDKTAANKALAVSLIEDVLMGKNPGKLTEYISAAQYHQHNPDIKDGLSGLVEVVQQLTAQNNMFKYKTIHKVLGEGNFVLTVSEGEWSVPLLASMLQHVLFTYGFNLNAAKRLVGDLTPEQMCQQPHGVVNHPAWSLGHLAGASVGILKALGHDASLPAAWGDVFKTGGIPSADPRLYPSKEELLATYEALHAQVAAAVVAADAATLAQAHPNEGTRKYFPTVGDMIVFLMTAHEMDHLGQLAAWRRALGLAAPARA